MLLSLLTLKHPQSKLIRAYAVGQLDEEFVNSSSKNIQAVKKVLPTIEGTPEWLMAVNKLQIKGQEKPLFQLMVSDADVELRKEAAAILFKNRGRKTCCGLFQIGCR